jgi:hypothetical protein
MELWSLRRKTFHSYVHKAYCLQHVSSVCIAFASRCTMEALTYPTPPPCFFSFFGGDLSATKWCVSWWSTDCFSNKDTSTTVKYSVSIKTCRQLKCKHLFQCNMTEQQKLWHTLAESVSLFCVFFFSFLARHTPSCYVRNYVSWFSVEFSDGATFHPSESENRYNHRILGRSNIIFQQNVSPTHFGKLVQQVT